MSRPVHSAASARDRASSARSIVACLASASLAFALGRITATPRVPSGRPAPDAALVAERNAPPSLPRTRSRRPSGTPESAVASEVPAAAPSSKEAEIIRLLSQFKDREMHGLDSELLALVAWANDAGEDDLALFMALGKEILPKEHIYEGLILPLAFTRLTQLDAAAAFESYLALDEADRTGEVTHILFGSWVLQGSPRDAIDHALAIQRTATEENSSVKGVVGDMLERLLKRDPAQAREIATEFARSDDPLERKAATQTAGAVMSETLDKQGPEAALEWIANWPDVEAREGLRRQAMDRLLGGDEASRRVGMELFARMPNPGQDTIRLVAQQKVGADAAEAQAWALVQPPGETRSLAVQEVLEAMQERDQMENAAHWLAYKPTHPDFDPAYAKLAVSVFHSPQDYPAALGWAKRVADPEAATRLRGELIKQWLSMDQERATQVLGAAMETAIPGAP